MPFSSCPTRSAGRVLAGTLTALALGCGGPSAGPPGVLHPSARVRVMADALPRGWHVAEVGAVGECLAILVPQPPEQPVRLVPVSLRDVADLRVSSLYDGAPGAQGGPRTYAAGADTTAERWLAVDLEALRREHGDCTPM